MAILMIVMTIVAIALIIGWKAFKTFRVNIPVRVLLFKEKITQGNYLRYLSIAFCILCIILYISLRWALGIENTIKYSLMNGAISEFRSANLSIIFMLDLCSMLGIALPIAAIFDWKKQIVLKPLSLLSVLGGTLTIFFSIPDLYSSRWSWSDLIYGSRTIGVSDSDEPLMFMMHFWMVCIGTYVLTNKGMIKWRDIVITIAIILSYAAYICLMASQLNIKSHVTALVQGDYMLLEPQYYSVNAKASGHPSYKVFYDIFKVSDWRVLPVIAWSAFTVIIVLIVLIKNTISHVAHKKGYINSKQHENYQNKDFII